MRNWFRAPGQFAALILLLSVVPAGLMAQTGAVSLRGQITDPSGAAIPAATVTVIGPGGMTTQAHTDDQGLYTFRNLAAGAYTVDIIAKGFGEITQRGINVGPSLHPVVNAQLVVTMEKQEVTVQGESAHLSVSAANNAGALVIKGEALNSLSENPDDLQTELQALAGPAAGPNGGQIYINGFTGGDLPSKSDILEIRVNQNPFSAQYDRLGYGRIEITTKPGSAKFHGQVFGAGNESFLNSRNPFATTEPAYHSAFYNGSVGGPLGKKASFFFHFFRRDFSDPSIVDAVILDPNFTQTPFNQAVPHHVTHTSVGPQFDFQLSDNNVLTVRAELEQNHVTNNGIGTFSLPSQAYTQNDPHGSLQISDTQIVSAKTVNQVRFQYRRNDDRQSPLSLDPTLDVLGAFNGGGYSGGDVFDIGNYYELQNMTSISLGRHNVTFGGWLRDGDESDNATSGFNGTFTFNSLTAYQLTQQGLAQGLSAAQIRAEGGGASLFSLTTGNPLSKVNLVDGALYNEDEWRMRPNVSLTLGLRFETQNHIHDHADFAPRIGLAWGIGGGNHPNTVLRAGFGLFYDRFGESQVLEAQRLNGINQQRYLVNQPDFFPAIPAVSTLTGFATFPTIYQVDPNLHAPYMVESAIGLERQVGRKVTTSVTYINSHGVHQLLTRNINAPFPGTYDPSNPASGVRPFGNVGNIYQYESDGLFNENQLIANFNVRAGAGLNLFGYYTLSYADSNTGGVGSFPMNQYDIAADYGPAAWIVRNQTFLGGSLAMPLGFRLSPFMIATSGHPYNITTGQDLNGDSIFNDRPAFAAPGATGPNIVTTSLGVFNIAPTPGEPLIPINLYTGPAQFSLNARLSKTFGFGKVKEGSSGGGGYRGGYRGGGLGGRGLSGGGGPGGFFRPNDAENHRYQLEVSVMAHNVFNIVNLGTPVGNLSSPLFGQSNSISGGFFGSQSANRSLNLMLRFSF